MHPLVAVVDFTKVDEVFEKGVMVSTDFYSLIFKNYCTNKIKYGRQHLDFEEGNLVCIAPKQVIVFDDEVDQKTDKMGWGVFFHPDLIRSTTLAGKMRDYTFFTYEVSEALHLSDKELQNLSDCVLKIQTELQENMDVHSQTLIVSNIELLLNYCLRYYGRQFISRKNSNRDTIIEVERLLQHYFTDNNNIGLPTVKYLAEKVNLSAGYLSDVLKKETGLNTQDHIHYYIIEQAKTILLNTNQTVGEIAYSLGFEYPQYFSKLFKQKTGLSPIEFRNMN